jgi:hypothetical protein
MTTEAYELPALRQELNSRERMHLGRPLPGDFGLTGEAAAQFAKAVDKHWQEYSHLAVRQERERCAKVAESFATCPCNGERGRCMENDQPRAVAAAIRAG